MSWSLYEYNTPQSVVVNWASIISSLIIISYVIFLKLRRPAYLDRVSLKIQIAIAVIDIIRHLNYTYGSNLGADFCKFSAFLYFFTFHANTFLNTAIALNLQIIYLHEWLPFQHLGFYLYIIPILLAMTIDLVPFTLDAYGESYNGFCFLKLGLKNREMMKIFFLYATNLPLLIYCFIIPVILMLKLFLTRYNYEDIQGSETHPLLSPIRNLLSRTLGFRVSLYPLACSLCHTGVIFSNIYISFNNQYSPVLGSSGYFGLSIYGLVNLLCFLLDPYIQESWNPPQLLIDEQINTYSEQELNPNTERTKLYSDYSVTMESSSESENRLSDQQATSSRSIGSSFINGNSSQKQCTKSEKPEKPKKTVRFDLDSTRYYIAPIPIPGARSPDEYRREVWHTTDLHLDIRKRFRLN